MIKIEYDPVHATFKERCGISGISPESLCRDAKNRQGGTEVLGSLKSGEYIRPSLAIFPVYWHLDN